MSTKKSIGLVAAGALSAIAASLCCITPVLALISGTTGAASAFAWMEPFRPYLIGITILVLGIAWYQKLRTRKGDEIACACEEDEKPSFWQSKLFLGIVTVFSLLMLLFPYYSQVFYPKSESKVIVIEASNLVTVNLEIDGMTCQSCSEHIKYAVAKLPGYIESTADHKTGKANVKFDKTKTSLDEVINAINNTGYLVVNHEIIKK